MTYLTGIFITAMFYSGVFGWLYKKFPEFFFTVGSEYNQKSSQYENVTILDPGSLFSQYQCYL